MNLRMRAAENFAKIAEPFFLKYVLRFKYAGSPAVNSSARKIVAFREFIVTFSPVLVPYPKGDLG